MKEILNEYGSVVVVMLSVVLSCSLLFVFFQGIRECMPVYATVETPPKADYFLSIDCPQLHVVRNDIRLKQGEVLDLRQCVEVRNQYGEPMEQLQWSASGKGVHGLKFYQSQPGAYRVKLTVKNPSNETKDFTYIHLIVEEDA